MWVATEDGLFRYDGNEFVIYKNEPNNPNSLPHNSVQALFCDEVNNIWALTDYGIGIYDQKTDLITQVIPGEASHQIPHKSVTSIASRNDSTKIYWDFWWRCC